MAPSSLPTHTTMTTVLNTEQAAALSAVKSRRNIFLTGAGGTGKSHTIRAIVNWATSAGIRCAVTAMTGCAALLLNSDSDRVRAKTLHSWAGIGLGRESPGELAEIVRRNRRAKRRWTDTQLLIVDEVSMMTTDLLEKLDLISKRLRPTGDRLQLVLAGDFCQLPPVTSSSTSTYVFESTVWKTLIEETHNLTQIVRQTDPVFQQLLTEARMGELSPASIQLLRGRMNIDWQSNDIRPTLLFSRNAEVDTINRKNMEVLDGERRTYEVQTVFAARGCHPSLDQAAIDKLDKDAPYEKSLELCMGAQVMLLTNLDQEHGLVNGSRGVITGYSPGGLPMVRFLSMTASVVIDRANWWLDEMVGRAQIPLKVAYAITIHKSQGATLDSALVDVGSKTFEYGQAYVALSRCRTLEGLYVWKLDPTKIMCHPAVVAFYKGLK